MIIIQLSCKTYRKQLEPFRLNDVTCTSSMSTSGVSLELPDQSVRETREL